MAEVYDRLGRLDRREHLARRAAQPAMPRFDEAPEPGGSDGFAEVLEAVGRVVRRWPGVSVMVAQDGRPGQPVIRMSERDGDVDAAVVGYQAATPPEPPRAVETAPVELPRAVPEPVQAPRVGTGRMAEALGGATRATRPGPFSASASAPEPQLEKRRPGLRLVPDLPSGRHASPDDADDFEDPEETPPGPSGRVPLPAETSEAVTRLAQILRANPSLAATWGRESQEG